MMDSEPQSPPVLASQTLTFPVITFTAVDALGNGVPNVNVEIVPMSFLTDMYYPHIPTNLYGVDGNTNVRSEPASE